MIEDKYDVTEVKRTSQGKYKVSATYLTNDATNENSRLIGVFAVFNDSTNKLYEYFALTEFLSSSR